MSLIGYSLEQERLLQLEDARLDKLETTLPNEGVYSKVPQTQYNAKIAQLDEKDATHAAAILDVQDKKLDVIVYNDQVLNQSSIDGTQTGRLDALDILVASKVATTSYNETVTQLTNANSSLTVRADLLDERFDAINEGLAGNIAAQIENKATNLEYENLATELRNADSALATAIATKVTEATQLQVDALQNTDIGTRLLISDYEAKMAGLDASNANIEAKLLAMDQFIRLLADTYVIKDSYDNIKNYSASYQPDLGVINDTFFSFESRQNNNILNMSLPAFAYNTFYGSINYTNNQGVASNFIIKKVNFDSVNFIASIPIPHSSQFPLVFTLTASDNTTPIYTKTLEYSDFLALENVASTTSPTLGTTNSNSSFVFNIGDSVNIQITNTGGAWSSIGISPDLSNGLSLNTTTGLISGTCTGSQAVTSYTITANNSAGVGAFSVDIEILPAAPTPSYIRFGVDQSTVSAFPNATTDGLVINGVNSYTKTVDETIINLYKDGVDVGEYQTNVYTYAYLTSASRVIVKRNNIEYDIGGAVVGTELVSNGGDGILAYNLVTRVADMFPDGTQPPPVYGPFNSISGREGLYLVTFGQHLVENNFVNNMITFTKIGNFGIIGAAVGGWQSDRVKFVKSPTSDYSFVASSVPFTAGQFRIRSDNGWPTLSGPFTALDIETDGLNNVTGTGSSNFVFSGVESYYDVTLHLRDPTRMALELTPSSSLTPANPPPALLAPVEPVSAVYNITLDRIVFTFDSLEITNSITFVDLICNYGGSWNTSWRRLLPGDIRVSGFQVSVPVPNGRPDEIHAGFFFNGYGVPSQSYFAFSPPPPAPSFVRYGPDPATIPVSPVTMSTGLVVDGANTYSATTISADIQLQTNGYNYTTSTYSYAYLSNSTPIYVKINGTEYDLTSSALESNYPDTPDETFYFSLAARDAVANPNGAVPPIALWGPANPVGQGLYLVTYGVIKEGGVEISKGISFSRMTEFGLIGTAVGGWDSLKAIFTKSVNDGLVYTASSVSFTNGEFKIRTADGWPSGGTIYNALDIEGNGAGGLQSIDGPDISFTGVNGTYNVVLHVRNPYTMTLELTPV